MITYQLIYSTVKRRIPLLKDINSQKQQLKCPINFTNIIDKYSKWINIDFLLLIRNII